MTKSVEYEIKIIDSPGNAAAIRGLRDSVHASVLGIEESISRVGAAASSSRLAIGAGPSGTIATPDYASQLDAIDRFHRESTSRFGVAGADAKTAFSRSLGGLADDLKGSGEKIAKGVRSGVSSAISTMSGLSGADLETLLHADDNDILRLSEDTADKYRDGLRARLGSDLGVSGKQSDELFGAKGGKELAGQQKEHQDKQSASLDNIGATLDQLDQLQAKGKQTSAELSRGFREIAEKAEQGASGIAQMAQGLSFLFADSKDAKVLIDTLLMVKGTSDLVLGGFKSVSGALQVFSLFSDRSEKETQQQKEKAQATRLTQNATLEYVKWLEREGIELESVTRGNKEHADALRQVAVAAERATQEEKQLAHEQAKGDRQLGGRVASHTKAGKGKSGLVGSILSTVGYAGVNSLSDRLGDKTGIIDNLGDAGMDYATENAGKLRGGGGKLLKYGKVAGSVLATAAIAKIGYDTAAGGGTIDPKSYSGQFFGAIGTNRTVGKIDQFIGSDNPSRRLADSFDELEKAVKRNKVAHDAANQADLTSTLNIIAKKGTQQIEDFRFGAKQKVQGLLVDNRNITASESAISSEADAAKALAAEMAIINDYQESLVKDEKQYLDSLERAGVLYDQLGDAQQQIITGVKQEASERFRINSEGISAAENRISLIEKERGIYRTNEEKLEAAAQKFGRLNQEEKSGVLKAQERAKAGGELTRKEKEQLESLGLSEESSIVKKQDLAEADKFGFKEKFGRFEKSQLTGSKIRQEQFIDLQSRADAIGNDGNIKDREKQLLDLSKSQATLGQRQQAASERTGFDVKDSDRKFSEATQQVRVEIQGRKDFEVQVKLDTEALISGVIERIKSTLEEHEKTFVKLVADGVQNGQADATAKAQAAYKEAQLKRRNSNG